MASREYYKKLQQAKMDNLLKPKVSLKDSETVGLKDAFPSEETADYMMNKQLRGIYEHQFSKELRSEKHYREWLKQQGRNEKGYVVTTIVDSLDVENRSELTPKDRMKFQCRLHDEARLSYAKEVYEAIPRDKSFKQFLKSQIKLDLLDTDSTFNRLIKVRSDNLWCNYIADKYKGEDITEFNVLNDTRLSIKI